MQLFRAEAATFATEGPGREGILVGVLLRGMVRTETEKGLLVSDARESPRIWIMPARARFAVTAVPGHAPAILGAAIGEGPFARYLEDATRGRPAVPEAPRVIEDPVAALGIEAFHRSLWSDTGPLEWESFLVTSLRRLFDHGARPTPVAEPRGVGLAREYLHAHYREAVPLEQLATVAGLSKYHLVRAFRAAVGVPPHTYQLRLRLTRSLFLLREGLPLSAIAYELGFADQSHYTRAFRVEFGITPGAWLRTTTPARTFSQVRRPLPQATETADVRPEA
ncbi:Transcriptional regulator, AraC family protein [Minicystis rosea]|nr:Transcriptional regulator, AraC family protein [Minicystis rosea]